MTEWATARLGEIATHIKDGTHGTHKRVESGIPFLSAKNVGANGKLAWDKSDDLISHSEFAAITSVFQPRRDDLLLTIVGSVGRSALFDGSAVAFQRSVAFVRPGPQVLPAFLHQASQAVQFTRQLERRSNVTAQAGLYLGELAKVEIPLPPKDVQQCLSAILSSLDSAIEATEALIEKHQQVKAGLMQDLFARGTLDDGIVRPSAVVAPNIFQDSVAGPIPQSWRLAPLGEVCSVIVDCPHSTPSFQADGVLVARTMHIKDGAFHEAFASRVSEREYARRVERAVPLSGDVVLTREAPVGEAFVIPPGMRVCLGQRVMLIRPNRDCLLPDYLVNQIYGGFVGRQMRDQVAGTTNPHLNVADVRRLLVPLPPIDEQISIAKALSAQATRIGADQALLAKLRLQKLGLMQDLLTGKVRVPLAEPCPA